MIEFYIDPEEQAISPQNGSSTKMVRGDWEHVVVNQILLSELIIPYSGKNMIIKIDIEGSETEALRDLINSKIDFGKTTIFLEEHRGLMKSEAYNNELDYLVRNIEAKGAHVAFWV